MNFSRIEGPATICHCATCNYEAPGGTESFPSASTGEIRTPEDFYVDGNTLTVYCATCAAKLVQDDPTRSVNQFYLDTAGTQSHPDVL